MVGENPSEPHPVTSNGSSSREPTRCTLVKDSPSQESMVVAKLGDCPQEVGIVTNGLGDVSIAQPSNGCPLALLSSSLQPAPSRRASCRGSEGTPHKNAEI